MAQHYRWRHEYIFIVRSGCFFYYLYRGVLSRRHMPGHGRFLPASAAGTVFGATGHAIKVATATAISHIADWQIPMRTRYVVIRVACSAFRLVCREWPCDDLVVGSMTINAEYCCSMITGIICRVMCERNQRYPACRIVAAVTIQGCDKVCC